MTTLYGSALDLGTRHISWQAIAGSIALYARRWRGRGRQRISAKDAATLSALCSLSTLAKLSRRGFLEENRKTN